MTGEASEDLTGVTAICVNEALGCLPALLFVAKSAFWWASLTAWLLSAGSRGPSVRPSLSFRVPRRTLTAAELSWGLKGTHWTVRPAASVNLSSVCFMPQMHKEAFFLSHFVLFLIPFIYIWFFFSTWWEYIIVSLQSRHCVSYKFPFLPCQLTTLISKRTYEPTTKSWPKNKLWKQTISKSRTSKECVWAHTYTHLHGIT